ncbi:MAG: hypothetical protein OQK24_02635 [Magnetovibrio sp.]|nr:hypothetical protein [Magnetovibrio sp.]
MSGLTLFLTIFATGTSFIALWVIADVTRKLTRQTQDMVNRTQGDMTRLISNTDQKIRQLQTELYDHQNAIIKLNKAHKKEVARLNTHIAEMQQERDRPRWAVNTF